MNIQDFMIADESHLLLDGLGRQAIGLHLSIERKLRNVAAQCVSWRMETGETGFFRALAGKRRDFLRIEHVQLREYAVLIAARTFGTALHVSWLLIATPRLVNDLRRVFRINAHGTPKFEIGAELDVFDRLDLNALIGLSRLALEHAIRELSSKREDDDSLLNSKAGK